MGRCSISKAIPYDLLEGSATVSVDDPNCLKWGADLTKGVPAGRQVLFPRFVAYNTDQPNLFHTSLIEPPDIATPGIGLEMPETYKLIGGGIPNSAAFVEALSNNPETVGTLELRTEFADSRLQVTSAPAGVDTVGWNASKVILTGPVGKIRQALQSLTYYSPSGYFGTEDKLHAVLVSGSLKRTATTNLDVTVNCGGQQCGTGTLFSLGKFDQNGNFNKVQYVTSVSMCGTELPSKFYGYCGTKFRFDREDGQLTRYPTDEGDLRWRYCSNPSLLTHGSPANANQPNFPYVLYSPKARSYQATDRVTVFLYEQYSGYTASPETQNALTHDRFTLFFQFDTFDRTGGTVNFQLNNIEQGRNLRKKTDPFTFVAFTGNMTLEVKRLPTAWLNK